jgi:dTDP-4-dehydrorhamnose 3,5-epimerase-like enzyme
MVAELNTGNEYFGGKARLVSYVQHIDKRGILLPFDFDEMPFKPCRSFVITSTSSGTTRGGHGHRTAQQMLVCLHGRIEILMRDSNQEVTVVLEPGTFGVIFGPGIWCQQRYLLADSILLTFTDEPYNPTSYIQNST